MQRAIASKSRDYSSWFWLALFLGLAIVSEVVGVRTGDLGVAICGVGVAILGVFGFLCPVPLNANVRSMFQVPANVDPKVAALGGVGGALLLVGLAIRWLG